MTNFETQLLDFIKHKEYVLKSGSLLISYLIRNNKTEEALELAKRIIIHDNSKIYTSELDCLMKLNCNIQSFTNPKYSLSEEEKNSIEEHWKNNSHHPEHHISPENMSELDIQEMVCDWFSRSMQYKTDFLSFVITRQETRFHFPEKMFEKILEYCNIILNEYNETLYN